MKCVACGFEQDEGKFCAKCGGKLESKAVPNDGQSNSSFSSSASQTVEERSEAATTEQSLNTEGSSASGQNVSPVSGDSMEQVKETSRAYWNYFTSYLKRPSTIFDTHENEFVNGIISILIAVFIGSLSFYMLLRNFTSELYDYVGANAGVSFLPVFGNAFIFTLISVVLIIAILFGINMLFGTGWSFKRVVSIYGAHMNPVIVFTVLTFLLILLNSYTYGSLFLIVYVGLLLTVVPVYLISNLLSRVEKPVDPLYGYLIYLVAVAIVFMVFAGIVVDSAFGELIDEFMYYY